MLVVAAIGAAIGAGIRPEFSGLQSLYVGHLAPVLAYDAAERDAVQIVGLTWLVASAACDIIIVVSLSVYLVGPGCCNYRAIFEADIQLRRIDTRQA